MQEVAGVLARMASDDAADLLLEIEQDRRIPVLNLLPAAKQLKIKRLLGYNPSTAGGLMNPDFASLPADATVAQAREYVRDSELAPSQLLAIWVIDADGRLVGGVFSSELLRAEPRRERHQPDRDARSGDLAADRASGGRAVDGRLQPARDARHR